MAAKIVSINYPLPIVNAPKVDVVISYQELLSTSALFAEVRREEFSREFYQSAEGMEILINNYCDPSYFSGDYFDYQRIIF